jgi:hypothetical protein
LKIAIVVWNSVASSSHGGRSGPIRGFSGDGGGGH